MGDGSPAKGSSYEARSSGGHLDRPRFLRTRSIDGIELENLAFILTDRCDFDCTYCYESKGAGRLDPSTLIRAIDLFRPYFGRECVVTFYGGEPLLEFDLIRRAVEHFEALPPREGHRVKFSLVTNGGLLGEENIEFLARHGFSLALSFDGLAQDITRKKGTYDRLVAVVRRILADPRISLETNSVFSAETVGLLSASVDLLVGLGVPDIDINFAHKPLWTPAALLRLEQEIAQVVDLFVSRCADPRDVPWTSLSEEGRPGVRYCPAGVDRLAVSAQGTIWGCAVFPHYLRDKYGPSGCQDYCFGDVEAFAKDPRQAYAQKIAAYAWLRMDRFSTPDKSCLTCEAVEHCWVCPLAAGLTTGEIGKIASASCRRSRILMEGKRRLLGALDGRDRGNRGEGRL